MRKKGYDTEIKESITTFRFCRIFFATKNETLFTIRSCQRNHLDLKNKYFTRTGRKIVALVVMFYSLIKS